MFYTSWVVCVHSYRPLSFNWEWNKEKPPANMFQKFLLMHLINILPESAAGATYLYLKLAGSINLV